MEMEKLYGLEQKVEMCPDPSHLELWKWKIYMDQDRNWTSVQIHHIWKFPSLTKCKFCGTYKSGCHGNFFLQTMSE